MGQDLRTSIMQIGKALQDPVAGILALRRAGVSFDESQRAMIESLVRSGKLINAQKMILGELRKEFGGAAAADANTMSGRISQMKNAWGDLAETVGGKAAPALQLVAEVMRDIAAMKDIEYTPKEAVQASAADGRLSKNEAMQAQLRKEAAGINRRGDDWGFGGIDKTDEQKARLAEIKEELALLEKAAAAIRPTVERNTKAATGIFKSPQGEKPHLNEKEQRNSRPR